MTPCAGCRSPGTCRHARRCVAGRPRGEAPAQPRDDVPDNVSIAQQLQRLQGAMERGLGQAAERVGALEGRLKVAERRLRILEQQGMLQ